MTLISSAPTQMAGEYSRELSAKITQAHRRYAGWGFHQGGTPNYGLRRILIDQAGRSKMALGNGQQKNLRSEHVVLAPGPDNEIRIVREIFRLFVEDGTPHKRIARLLNEKGLRTRRGKRWSGSNIRDLLSNEKYVGTYVYNRTSMTLGSKRIYHRKADWVRIKGAIEPIIDSALFTAAQRILSVPWAIGDNDLLDYLTATWCVNGYLSAAKINCNKYAPSVTTYHERFGSLGGAYDAVGYKATHNYRHDKIADLLHWLDRDTIWQVIATVERRGARIEFDERSQRLQIDKGPTVAIIMIPYLVAAYKAAGWKIHFDRVPACDLILMARLNKENAKVLDYHLLPYRLFSTPAFRFTDKNLVDFKSYKLKSLDRFLDLFKRIAPTPPQVA